MALCHLPGPSVLASRELQPTPSVSRLAEEHLRWGTQWSASCRALLLSCSAKKSRASRRSRVTKSNADLCNELREFVFAAGLPEDHVPSTKELLEHGRKDLAYIVRRRGYKEITKLLMKPTNGDTTREEDLANVSDFGKVSAKESIEGLETQDNMYRTPAGGAFLPSCSSMEEKSSHEGATSCSQSCESEIIGDSVEREDTRIHNGYKFTSKMHYADGVDEGDMGSQLSFPLTRGEFSSRFIDKNFSVQFLDELELPFRDDVSLEKILGNSDLDENKASDLTEERANQAEIDHLKELLHQKEMELTTLKQQIEKEKIALSTTQNKVQSEISKVQNIISTKDEELRAAEESLSGLKEVLIEYWGHGEIVEVAGSFNGWQHRVKMDSHKASKTANSNGSREAILWTTILWLYPGIYEALQPNALAEYLLREEAKQL